MHLSGLLWEHTLYHTVEHLPERELNLDMTVAALDGSC